MSNYIRPYDLRTTHKCSTHKCTTHINFSRSYFGTIEIRWSLLTYILQTHKSIKFFCSIQCTNLLNFLKYRIRQNWSNFNNFFHQWTHLVEYYHNPLKKILWLYVWLHDCCISCNRIYQILLTDFKIRISKKHRNSYTWNVMFRTVN